MSDITRRKYLVTSGIAIVGSIAGCSGGDDSTATPSDSSDSSNSSSSATAVGAPALMADPTGIGEIPEGEGPTKLSKQWNTADIFEYGLGISNYAVSESGIYIVNRQGFAEISKDGEVQWSQSYDFKRRNPGVIDLAGNQAIGRNDETLAAVSLADGSQKWTWEHPTGGRVSQPIAGPDGTVYFTTSETDNGRVVTALDTANQKIKWEVETNGGEPRAVANGKVYTSVLREINAESGKANNLPTSNIDGGFGGVQGNQIGIQNGTLYGVDYDGIVFAINLESKENIWSNSFSIVANWSVSRTSFGSERVYVCGREKVWAFSKQTGDTDWTYSAPSVVQPSPTLSNSYLYFPTDGGITVLDKSTGEAVNRHSTGDPVTSLAFDGKQLYGNVQSYDSGFTSFQAE